MVPAKHICWCAADLWEPFSSAMLTLCFSLSESHGHVSSLDPSQKLHICWVWGLASLKFAGSLLVLACLAYMK